MPFIWFRPHTVFAVFGYYKMSGYMTTPEKFLEIFEKKHKAQEYLAQVKTDGVGDGCHYIRFEIKELNPKP